MSWEEIDKALREARAVLILVAKSDVKGVRQRVESAIDGLSFVLFEIEQTMKGE
jgi:predicted metal-binding protein